MAGRGAGTVCPILLLLLACLPLSQGRIVPAGLDPASLPGGSVGKMQGAGGAELDGVIASLLRGDEKSCSPMAGEVSSRIGATGSDRHAEYLAGSVIRGLKWERKIAEWVFHACVVTLAVFVLFYTVSFVCACCIGLDILAEIWRLLGGWQGFSYFVHIRQVVVETEPEPIPPHVRTAAPT